MNTDPFFRSFGDPRRGVDGVGHAAGEDADGNLTPPNARQDEALASSASTKADDQPPPRDGVARSAPGEPAKAGLVAAAQDRPPAETSADSIAAYARGRLAAFASFDQSRGAADLALRRINEAMASVVAAHDVARDFLDDCYADMDRITDLALQNAALAAEARRLRNRSDLLEKQLGRYEKLIALHRRRAYRMDQDFAALRQELDKARRLDEQTHGRDERFDEETQSLHGEAQNTLNELSSVKIPIGALQPSLSSPERKEAGLQGDPDGERRLSAASRALYGPPAASAETGQSPRSPLAAPSLSPADEFERALAAGREPASKESPATRRTSLRRSAMAAWANAGAWLGLRRRSPNGGEMPETTVGGRT